MQFKYRLAIPKIKCGDLTSTGFLVKENIVITALHAIGPYLRKEAKDIEVFFITDEGRENRILATPLLTDSEEWKNFQIIALKLSSVIDGVEPLKCINYKFSSPMDCFTYGYPAVRDATGTLVDLEVRGEFKLSRSYPDKWNIDLKAKGDAIKNYKGCSGGPLLFKNSVVGIMLEQSSEGKEASRLSAISLYIYKEYLEHLEIAVRENCYDDGYKDYIVLTKQFLNTQLANNISRKIEDNSITPLGFSIKVETKGGKKPYDFRHLLENESSSIVLSKPGGGKSYLLMMLMLEIIENPILSIAKVPIMLKAKNWYRDYKSIIEGIKKELLFSSPGITDEEIIQGLTTGKFILLIDGLDEVVSYKDLFIEQINRISQLPKLKVIITCREQNYHSEFHNLFNKYNLKPLTDNQIEEYTSAIFEEDITYSVIISLRRSIKDLIRNPLFLYMTTQIMKNITDNKIPKNRSELYNQFIGYLMENRLLQNGIIDSTEFELNLKCEILSEYAYINFRKLEATTTLREVATSYINPDDYSKLKKELLKTGVLIEERDEIDFFHPSFEEYFVALKISKMSEEEIFNYIQEHHSEEAYVEVFKFASGLLRYLKQQNFLLDNLEKINLFLYRQCLETRFNFENSLHEEWSQVYLRQYFMQVRKSYLTMINQFFGNIKNEFYPWSEVGKNLPDDKLSIIGSLDVQSSSLNVGFSINENSDSVIIRKNIRPPAFSTMDDKGTPVNLKIISFQGGDNWYFDLEATDFGLDSAREVALYIIKKQLKKIIDNQQLLVYESPESLIPCIEYVLSRLPIEKFFIKNNGLKEKLSLYKHSIGSIVETLWSEEKIIVYVSSIRGYGDLTRGYVSGMLYALLQLWKAKVDFKKYLLPPPDLERKNDGRMSHPVFEVWSDEQLEKRISAFFEFYQIAYRNLVKKGFPVLSEYMPFYSRGPVQFYIALNRNEVTGGSITYAWNPVESIEESKPLIKDKSEGEHLFEGLHQWNEEVNKKLRELGSGINYRNYRTASTSLTKIVIDERELRKKVYQELSKDLQSVLGKF